MASSARTRRGALAAHVIVEASQHKMDDVVPMKVREVVRLLAGHGWKEMRSKGSHRHFKHPDQRSVITMPGNDGKELAAGTLNARLKKAGL